MKTLIPVLLAPLLASCVFWTPPAEGPIAAAAPAQRQSDTLLILLPGRGDRGPDFGRHGFLEIGRGHGFDMLAADAHWGYYMERNITQRLHQDIVRPARARGYEHIWLLGISAGGLGANLYARAHPQMIEGIILLAPYPGDDDLVADIERAGGLDQWSGSSAAGAPFQRATWRWLQDTTRERGQPRIVLGYGRDDRFAGAGDLLAARLPDDQVFTAEGGHRWPVWRRLWTDIVAAGYPR